MKYRFLTDRDLTIKGRLLNAFSRRPSSDFEFWALRNVSVELRQQDVVGLIGANGSGKSTLLRVMARILQPAEGSLSVDGEIRPLLDLGGTMNPNLTGRENAFLYGALNRMPRTKVREILPKVIDFAELGPFFDVPVKTYSSGMLTRLSFSLATATRPDILLIDEVLSVGDQHFQRKSYFRMMKLIEQGSLVVIASHDLSFIEQVCTRTLLLSSGRIAADGRPRDIVAEYRRQITG